MTETNRIEALAAQYTAAMPDLDPGLQQAALTLLRLLAQGEPVGVQRLSEALGMPAPFLDEALDGAPGVFRDEHRRVIRFLGLSVVEVGDHRMQINGRSLWADCAWDTLYLPELLSETARVSSRCPITDSRILLTVTPNGVSDLDPPETVVSYLLPGKQFEADVVQSFCHFIHFLSSPAAAESWIAEHPETFALSVEDAFRLGQLTNRASFDTALAERR